MAGCMCNSGIFTSVFFLQIRSEARVKSRVCVTFELTVHAVICP